MDVVVAVIVAAIAAVVVGVNVVVIVSHYPSDADGLSLAAPPAFGPGPAR